MEDDAAEFLKRIVKTLSTALLWLLIQMTIGIYMGWMFFAESPTLGNIVYYIFFITTFSALLYYFYRVWKEHIRD